MGNITSQRVNSEPSCLDFSIRNAMPRNTNSFSKEKKNPRGLSIIFKERNPLVKSTQHIVFPPPLIAIYVLYSIPREVWSHPIVGIHDIDSSRFLIPTSIKEITSSEEYTCVVSIKDGYPKMTHVYGDKVIEVIKHCYICKKDLIEDIYMYKDETFCSEECRAMEMNKDSQKARKLKHEKKMESERKLLMKGNREVVFYIGDVPD